MLVFSITRLALCATFLSCFMDFGSHFKVLAHTKDFGDCAKIVKNVFRQQHLGGEKLHIVHS